LTRFFSFCLAAILIAAFARPAAISAAEFPGAARVAERIPLGGGYSAIIYAADGDFVGVMANQSGKSTLVWHKRLPYSASELFPAGSPGGFAGIGRTAAGPGEFFAYRFDGVHVHPAIHGDGDGLLTAGEGVRLESGDVVLRSHDSSHQGSVSYALVTRYRWSSDRYISVETVRRPDYANGNLPHPRAEIKTGHGDTILIRLEVASTESQRETGLMYRSTLDADSGMVFVWDAPVFESFWMENTLIPLTVAFLSPDGTIQEMQDMQPQTTDLHTPAQPYQYALEANQGFFVRNGIRVGDRVNLTLT
jgi:uncharacterized membrane protein (UPF0127 family)